MTGDDRAGPEFGLERPSKSELKRRVQALYKRIEQLAGLAEGELAKGGLSAETLCELAQIRRMRPSHARNRAVKHLAAGLAESEWASIHALLDDRKTRQAEEARRFHAVEAWRDRLVVEGDAALDALCAENPEADRQHLRSLVRAAQKDRAAGRSAGAARKLFQALRDLLP